MNSTDLLARRLGADSITATTAAGSGHPTSALSAAHLVATLLEKHLRLDVDDPDNPANDRLVLSKGHAAPILYAAIAALGALDRSRLDELRTADSALEGHPVPTIPFVDVATGSLGQGLANGLGMSLALRRLGSPGRVWVILGDSEMAEGSVWEAMALAAHHRLSNLVAVLDMNRLGQTGETMYGWDSELYARRAEAFGWHAVTVDGHDPDDISRGYVEAETNAPAMVIARTVKGFGVSSVADEEDQHGKALDAEQARAAIEELDPPPPARIQIAPPDAFEAPRWTIGAPDLSSFDEAVSTREAFGKSLAAFVAADERLMVFDAEVGNSTKTDLVQETASDRFVQMFIAEQAMVGAATGMQALGLIPVISTFGAFLTRAHDFLRMAAISRARLVVNGSHAGVSIGEDGPSQMALEDIAMVRGLPGAVVLYPSDGNSTAALMKLAVGYDGISYIRTTRGSTPAQYDADDEFVIGGSKTVRESDDDQATVVAAGVTLFEAIEAADRLSADGTAVRVIDAYSIQPIDEETLRTAARETGRIVTVEDHGLVGGLGDAVAQAVSGLGIPLARLAVSNLPGSADPDEQLRLAGISADAVVQALKDLLPDERLAREVPG